MDIGAIGVGGNDRMKNAAKPEVVSAPEWQQARDDLLTAEQEATRILDALAARRRRLPMVKFSNDYAFDAPDGPVTLAGLFEGRDQLAVYQFMDAGPGRYCPACTASMNGVTGIGGLAEAGVTWAVVSDMPLAQIEPYKAQMGWTFPFVSSRGTSFSGDCGAGAGFLLSVFLRDGADVYRTYVTAAWTGCFSPRTSSTCAPTAARKTGRTPRPAGPSTSPTSKPRSKVVLVSPAGMVIG